MLLAIFSNLLFQTFLKVLLLALIDCLRIKFSWSAVVNINHRYSVLYDVIGSTIILAIPTNWPYFFEGSAAQIMGKMLLYIFMVVSGRVLFYDPALNLMRGRRLDYVSNTTSAITDQKFKRWGFLKLRLIGLAGFAVCSVIYFLIKQ